MLKFVFQFIWRNPYDAGTHYNPHSLPKLQMRHVGFSLYRIRESDEGADTDLMFNFQLPEIKPLIRASCDHFNYLLLANIE